VIRILLDSLHAANLDPWSKKVGFVNVVLYLMTEEEPAGKILWVYNKNKTTLEVKCMCIFKNTPSPLRFGLIEYVIFILL
jgi:hypothetical protein